jgi:hypothetical protein
MNTKPGTFYSAYVYGLENWDANLAFTPTVGIMAVGAVSSEPIVLQDSTVVVNLLPGFEKPDQAAQNEISRAEFFEFKRPEVTRYKLLRKLEGTVIRSESDHFVAHLTENSGDFPFIEVEIDFSELPEEERSLAVEGASLVWTVGYRYQGQTMKRESEIYFRRLPPWTSSEAKKAFASAQDLLDAIRK